MKQRPSGLKKSADWHTKMASVSVRLMGSTSGGVSKMSSPDGEFALSNALVANIAFIIPDELYPSTAITLISAKIDQLAIGRFTIQPVALSKARGTVDPVAGYGDEK